MSIGYGFSSSSQKLFGLVLRTAYLARLGEALPVPLLLVVLVFSGILGLEIQMVFILSFQS